MRRLCLVIAGLFLFALSASAQSVQRVALVIGNGGYVTPGWALANPPRDARLMADRLRGLGFDVELVVDARRADMEGAFARFGARLKRAGGNGVGLFYYAGHGAQSNGVNLLVPVDSTARTMDRLRLQAPPMQFLLDDMAEAGNAVNIVVLDACRNIPLEEGFRDGGGGLADVGRLPNVFIAYAAAPGRTSADGAGLNSPYTAALARALANAPDQPISLLFENVNAEVYRNTGFAQSPEFRNGLVRAPGWRLANARPAVGGAPASPSAASSAPATASAQRSVGSGPVSVLGLTLAPLDASLRARFSIPASVAEGVVVTGVERSSTSVVAPSCLQPGNVVVKVGDVQSRDPAVVASSMRADHQRDGKFETSVRRASSGFAIGSLICKPVFIPVVLTSPTPFEALAVLPASIREQARGVVVNLYCRVLDGGRLERCGGLSSEWNMDPSLFTTRIGPAVDPASKQLAHERVRVRDTLSNGASAVGEWAAIRIVFGAPVSP